MVAPRSTRPAGGRAAEVGSPRSASGGVGPPAQGRGVGVCHVGPVRRGPASVRGQQPRRPVERGSGSRADAVELACAVRPADVAAGRAGGREPAVRVRRGVPGVRRPARSERGGRALGPLNRVIDPEDDGARLTGAEPAGGRAGRAGSGAVARAGSSGSSGPGTGSIAPSASTTRSTRGTAWWSANSNAGGSRNSARSRGWRRTTRGSSPSNRATCARRTRGTLARWRRACRGCGAARRSGSGWRSAGAAGRLRDTRPDRTCAASEGLEELRPRLLGLRGNGRPAGAVVAALDCEAHQAARRDAFSGAQCA